MAVEAAQLVACGGIKQQYLVMATSNEQYYIRLQKCQKSTAAAGGLYVHMKNTTDGQRLIVLGHAPRMTFQGKGGVFHNTFFSLIRVGQI